MDARVRNLELLRRAGLVADATDRDFVLVSCPFALYSHEERTDAHPSFSISLETGQGKCFACGEQTRSLWDMFAFCGTLFRNKSWLALARVALSETDPVDSAVAESSKRLHLATAEDDSIRVKLETWFHGLPEGFKVDRVRQYMVNTRKFPARFGAATIEQLVWACDLRWDAEEQRVVFPIMNGMGKFVGCQGRSVTGAEPKCRHYQGSRPTLGFGGSSQFWTAAQLERTVVLVEGPFDMLRCLQYVAETRSTNLLPLCLFTCHLSQEQARILAAWYKPVIVMLDSDSAGKHGASEIKRRLSPLVPSVRLATLPDGVGDPDELTCEQFVTKLTKAK